MYRFIKKYGKQLMAVFSAVLMIAFMLPSAYKYAGAGRNTVVGKVGGEKIHAVEAYNAEQAWKTLAEFRAGRQGQSLAEALGPNAFAQISRRPIMFLLLQKEAERMGVGVDEDQLNSFMKNVPALAAVPPERQDQLRNALAQMLLVNRAFQRAVAAVKITDPMIRHELAELAQMITLNGVDFTAAQYLSKVPEPTAQQLKEQFEKYADSLKGTVSETNPFGFGYKYPDRIKLQYIAIPRAEVRKYVEGFTAPGKPKDPYEWEVEAQKYYIQHQNLYPTSKPAAGSDTFNLETHATTRPFTEVREQIKKNLIDEATEKKVAQMEERIQSILAQDYAMYKNAAGGATRPTTAPASSLGVPYDSFEYLQKLAQNVQNQTGVLPTVQSIADRWLTQADVEKLPGFGQAVLDEEDRRFPAAMVLMQLAAPFVAAENRNESSIIQEMQPTHPFADPSGSLYVARISAAQPAHQPATLGEVQADVKADVRTRLAYEMAKADAMKLLEQARVSGDLKSAAGGRAVINIGPLSHRPDQPILGLPVTGAAGEEFLDKAFKLLSGAGATTQPAATTNPSMTIAAKPIGLIELARDGRVVVAQVGSVQAMWTEKSRSRADLEATAMLTSDLVNRFSRDWYDYDSVKSRMNYVPDASQQKEQENRPAPPPAQPAPPIF